MNKYYVISMGLHGVLLIGLIKISNRSITPELEIAKRPPWIELREGHQGRNNDVTKAGVESRPRKQGKKINKTHQLSGLLHPSISSTIGSERPCSGDQLCSEEDSDYVADGSGAYLQRALEISRFSDKLWRKIRSEVHYKRSWIRRGYQGLVTTRILVSPGGRLLVHFIDELSGPQDFKSHIVGSLRRALSDDFLSPALRQPTIFHLSFNFRIGHEIPDAKYTLNSLVFNIVSPPPGDELQLALINPLAMADTIHSRDPMQRDKGVIVATGLHLPLGLELTKNAEPEDFYKTVARYETACLHHLNRYGCFKANSEYDKAGLFSEATRIYTQACARGLKEFCRNL